MSLSAATLRMAIDFLGLLLAEQGDELAPP
jgi:hypothetical protein